MLEPFLLDLIAEMSDVPMDDPQRDPNWCHSCGRMGPCPGESGH